MIAKRITLMAMSVLLLSCRAAAPWLDIQPVAVREISPDEGLVALDAFDGIRITYSASMNRALTEAATELRENGDTISTTFVWDDSDRRLTVRPVQGFTAGSAYELELGIGTEDTAGNSLSEAQIHRVATRSIEADLELSASSPTDGAIDVGLTAGIVLDFNNPLDRVAVLDALSIDPGDDVLYEYDNGDTRLTLTPVTHWTVDTRYIVSISTALLDTQGNALSQDREVRFRTVAQPAPELTQLLKVDTAYVMQDTDFVFTNNSPEVFEADVAFDATFSSLRAVQPAERLDAVSIRPSVDLDLTWAPDGLSVAIAFAERLNWETEYVLTVLEKDFRFQVDGPDSVPPALVAVHFIPNVAAPTTFTNVAYADSIAFPTVGTNAFDLYIQHAPGATIPLDAALQALSTSTTNGGIDVDVQSLEIAPLNPSAPPGANQTILRYIGEYYNNAASIGTLTLTLGTDLRDSYGNVPADEIIFLINE